MRRIPRWIFVAAPVGFAVFIAIGGTIVMLLWNWLAPTLVGLQQVTFWQALGLLALCRILFGGFGLGGGSHRASRTRTPEEHERMRQWFRNRSTRNTPPDSQSAQQQE